MKMKIVFAGLIAALFLVNALPVQATDFSGYVQATWSVDVVVGGEAHSNYRPIANGEAWMVLVHYYIENIGTVPLTEAIVLIEPFQLKYYDESGTLITVTDPVELAQLVRVENSEEMWNGGYVTWLGTVKPGQSRRSIVQFWIGVGNWTNMQLLP